MSSDPLPSPGEALPAVLPLFPLRGVILLPGAQLPLHVFEPRYRNLTLDAFGAGRMIGMIQPLPRSADGSALCPVGGAGRITLFSEIEERRFLIVLTGVSRFRMARELEPRRGYRRAVPDWAPFREDLSPSALEAGATAGLLEAGRLWTAARGSRIDEAELRPLEPAALLDALAMTLPFGPEERQALLEAPHPAARAELLRALLEADAAGPSAPVRH